MAKAIKPTKQQIAQAKARAGGNNPINVTNAGLKKLGSAAVIAASMTPVGRGIKAASMVAKAASTAKRTKIMANAEKKAEAMKISKTIAKKPSPSVKVVKVDKNVPREVIANRNKVATEMAARRKSGELAKTTASRVNTNPTGKPKSIKIKVSDNVTAQLPAKSNYEFAKDMSRFGKIQKQNAGPLKPTKAEAKANARGLKAANKKKK
jgi:hypothetical protein